MIKRNCSVCGDQEKVIIRLIAEAQTPGVRTNESTVCQNKKCVMYIDMAKVSTWRLK